MEQRRFWRNHLRDLLIKIPHRIEVPIASAAPRRTDASHQVEHIANVKRPTGRDRRKTDCRSRDGLAELSAGKSRRTAGACGAPRAFHGSVGSVCLFWCTADARPAHLDEHRQGTGSPPSPIGPSSQFTERPSRIINIWRETKKILTPGMTTHASVTAF